ncbi:S-adenosyl-L-methionine-dependent methyltransferase [Aspergillus ellipticus CBS 707.79]|uniref:S-adenosyl-L-methionine-dependent methyltransferase n=1 Tax=Aspergillus ellipticus CBS 707.79 TaxID=1448320 RepID=A0A319DEY2_9EURO|nr:S-adenosyl-L-methionine-dependent methyltransferase [Aspergillus ellipticus CBS 707.79]
MTSPDSETEELDAKYLHTIPVYGREYQKYSIDKKIYFQPVDDNEAERLEREHCFFNGVFDNRLIFPPIHNPRRILDCGHGAGSWSADVAEQYPDCEVIGVDISPHMNPDDVPVNLWLQVDDLNRSFTFPPNHFDLVHSRMLATGIDGSRWPSYIEDIKRVLRPGGWVQLVEMYFNAQSDNGSLTEEHALRQWSTKFMRSMQGLKDLRVGTHLRNLLTAAGMEEVDTRMIPLPLCEWSTDPRIREIGAANRESVRELLPSLSLYPLTQRLHMPDDVFQRLIAQAQEEANSPKLKAYFPLYVCIGRKPL